MTGSDKETCRRCGADRALWLKCSHIICPGGEVFGLRHASLNNLHPPLTDEALRGLDAIWRAAQAQGYRTGFGAGVGEKAWLHKSWPGIGILLFAFGMAVGIFVGVNA